MSYNRWMPVQYSSELYHHGVKGMKWGKHLFGKGLDLQPGAGGGGGGSNEEDLELLEKLKKQFGESKALEMFREMKQAAKGVADKTGYTAYKELQVADKERKKAWDNYFRAGGYDAVKAGSDEAKYAKQKTSFADMSYNVHKEKYEATPMHEAEQKIKDTSNKVKSGVANAAETVGNTAKSAAKKVSEIPDKVQYKVWEAEDNLGITSHYQVEEAKKSYEQAKEHGWDRYGFKEQKYKKTLEAHYKTPLGKAEKAVNAGKTAVSAFKDYMKNGPKTGSFDVPTRSTPSNDRPKSRKRNVTGKGTGVHLTGKVNSSERPLITRPRSRKRNVTGKGTGVHLYGPVSSYGRKK